MYEKLASMGTILTEEDCAYILIASPILRPPRIIPAYYYFAKPLTVEATVDNSAFNLILRN